MVNTKIDNTQPLISEPTEAKILWTVPAINTGIKSI
jgi:hypothetical protein